VSQSLGAALQDAASREAAQLLAAVSELQAIFCVCSAQVASVVPPHLAMSWQYARCHSWHADEPRPLDQSTLDADEKSLPEQDATIISAASVDWAANRRVILPLCNASSGTSVNYTDHPQLESSRQFGVNRREVTAVRTNGREPQLVWHAERAQ
jgi:hypothetical protein